jgi:hypothetical protein
LSPILAKQYKQLVCALGLCLYCPRTALTRRSTTRGPLEIRAPTAVFHCGVRPKSSTSVWSETVGKPSHGDKMYRHPTKAARATARHKYTKLFVPPRVRQATSGCKDTFFTAAS